MIKNVKFYYYMILFTIKYDYMNQRKYHTGSILNT